MDSQGNKNPSEPSAQAETFKQQLDRAAIEKRGSPQDNQQSANPILEKSKMNGLYQAFYKI